MASMCSPSPTPASVNQRKRDLVAYFEADNGLQDTPTWLNRRFRESDRKFMQFLIPPGKRVLELGCGSGDLLASLQPAYGVGVGFSPKALERARSTTPRLNFT